MKNALIDFLYWWLRKLQGQKVEKVEIGYHITQDLSRIIPKNGQWYHVALTAVAWVKFEKNEKLPLIIEDVAVYDGGAVKLAEHTSTFSFKSNLGDYFQFNRALTLDEINEIRKSPALNYNEPVE